VILCGSAEVGKTSILSRYVDGKFSNDYHQTTGANFLIKEIDLSHIIEKISIADKKLKEDIKKKGFKLYFWDIGGQKHSLFANEYYFMDAAGAMVIFDILNRESFNELDFWISKLKELSGQVPFIIIGNKVDMKDHREVSFEEAEEKAKSYGVEYIETSAKTDTNVSKAFEMLSIKILNSLK